MQNKLNHKDFYYICRYKSNPITYLAIMRPKILLIAVAMTLSATSTHAIDNPGITTPGDSVNSFPLITDGTPATMTRKGSRQQHPTLRTTSDVYQAKRP